MTIEVSRLAAPPSLLRVRFYDGTQEHTVTAMTCSYVAALSGTGQRVVAAECGSRLGVNTEIAGT